MRAAILGMTVLVAATAPAAAQNAATKAKAKAAYESGLKHYNIAEYPEAIKDWKESYSLSKKPLLLFNIGQAYRLAGDCNLAMTFYDSYQREEPNPKNQDELDEALALCAKTTDKPKVVDTPSKVIDKPQVIDKPKVIDTPSKFTEKPKATDKPPVTVGSTEPAGPSEPTEPVDSPTTSGGGLRKAGIGVGIAGVVLGGVGIYFARSSAKKSDELDGFQGEWGAEQDDLESAGKRSARLGWITGGAGIVAIVAGGVMYAIGGPKQIESVSVVPTRGGAAVGWSLTF